MRNTSNLPRKHRAGAIVVHNGKLLVNWRWKNSREFYVLPGGETEPGEMPEQAVVRELHEEASITATVDRLLYEVHYPDIDSIHRYFLCQYVAGNPEIRVDAEEQATNAQGDDVIRPKWLPTTELSSITLYPLEIRDALVIDIPAGFPGAARTISVNWVDRRQ